jgi:hypothetical protein
MRIVATCQILTATIARLLAQPVRACQLTRTTLPSSLLLKLHVLKDPEPPHQWMYLPLSLYQSSRRRDEPVLIPPKTALSAASFFVLRASVFAELEAIDARRNRTNKDRGRIPKVGARTMAVINDTLSKSIYNALRWPVRHLSRDFVASERLEDISNVENVAGIMFFGGRVRTQRVIDMERRVLESALKIETLLTRTLSWYPSRQLTKPLGHGGLVKANHRTLFEPLRLSTVNYEYQSSTANLDGNVLDYGAPVFPMIDILGSELAEELLKDTHYEGATWLAVKFGRRTTPAIEWLIKGAFWFSELKS